MKYRINFSSILAIGLISGIFLSSCSYKKGRVALSSATTIPPLDKSLAVIPPKGCNSGDCMDWGATEDEGKAAAECMTKNLKGLGYELIIV